MMMSTKKIRIRVQESKELKIVIAGVTYPCFLSALEMVARTIGLLEDEKIFENVQYRDCAFEVLFSKAKTFADIKKPALKLNNFYGYKRSMSPNKTWNITLCDVFSAVAADEVCKDEKIRAELKEACPEYYNFYQDFILRYKRKDHMIVIRGAAEKDHVYPPGFMEIYDVTVYLRLDFIDMMNRMGYLSTEIFYTTLKDYKKDILSLKERKEYKEGKVDILAYLDAFEEIDHIVGPSGLKFLEENNIEYCSSSYEFDISTINKVKAKTILMEKGVPTAPFVYLTKWDEEAVKNSKITYPVLIKLVYSAASYGMTLDSKCYTCLLYTSPSPRDLSTSRMPSSA
eukprot:TRINITY_DN5047_c0_g2_i13.p1 TRINITY_DN5047_c0_g2~~TRINITY_DN5047_c0_g2_i13.p1  ORF type:complete len:342 (-),score=54.33 TRINITY_DN5047_c0_g2_i13:66-1091(-)